MAKVIRNGIIISGSTATNVVTLTRAEYKALGEKTKTDNVLYAITDEDGAISGGSLTPISEEEFEAETKDGVYFIDDDYEEPNFADFSKAGFVKLSDDAGTTKEGTSGFALPTSEKNPSVAGSLAQQIDTLNKKNVFWDGIVSNKSFLQMVLEYYRTYGTTTVIEGFYRGGQASTQSSYPNPTDWMSFKFYIITDQVKAIFQDLDQKTYSISGTIVPEWTNNNVYGRQWEELAKKEVKTINLTNLLCYVGQGVIINNFSDKNIEIVNAIPSDNRFIVPYCIKLNGHKTYALYTIANWGGVDTFDCEIQYREI